MSNDLSRRTLLRNVALGITATGMIDRLGAQHVHEIALQERAATGTYQAKYFQPQEYLTVHRLAELIVPADDRSGSAVDAGAPEFIDLLCSQSQELGEIFSGGLAWLDAEMRRRFQKSFVTATPDQQTQMLDLLVEAERADRALAGAALFQVGEQYMGFSSYRASAANPLGPGIIFFDWIRKMTLDGFYTSRIGIKDLDFQGNSAHTSYQVPEAAIKYAMNRSPK